MWLYGFMTNVRSCRKLEAACRDQIPYLWLTGWHHPDHNTLWRFYHRHRQSMSELFKRTVRTAVTMELVELAVQAADGTKVPAHTARVPRGGDEDRRRGPGTAGGVGGRQGEAGNRRDDLPPALGADGVGLDRLPNADLVRN